jgi:hypothetical protein
VVRIVDSFSVVDLNYPSVVYDIGTDDDAVQRLTERKRPRVRERNRCHYKRANSALDALTINDVSSLAIIARSTSDRINLASFKKHFAASCLPSCVWNQSLPNLHFSSSWATTDRRVPDSTTLLPASSVEYFTPEENFVPQVGAYCTWSSSFDDQLIEGKPTLQFGDDYTLTYRTP